MSARLTPPPRSCSRTCCLSSLLFLNVQEDWLADLNPESLVVVKGAYATPDLAKAQPGERCVRWQASSAGWRVPATGAVLEECCGGCCNGVPAC